MIDRKEVYRKALVRWGKEGQMIAAIEEFSELTTILSKMLIGKMPLQSNQFLVDEIADIIIMTEQLITMFDCSSEVNKRINFKIKRLQERLDHE